MNKEEKEIWLKETYNYIKNTDFDKVECQSDIYLDYIMLYEENKHLDEVNCQLRRKIEDLNRINEEHRKLNGKLRENINQTIELIENSQIYNARSYGKTLFMKVLNDILASLKGGENGK